MKKVENSFDGEIASVFYDEVSFRFAKDIEKKYAFKKSQMILSTSALMKTYLPFDSYDFAICFGRDTNIGLSSRKPEVLASLLEKDISKKTKEQYESLLETSFFVKKDGHLLLMNNSILKEEGHDIVMAFLKKNSSFVLECEENALPDDYYHVDAGYYAIMRKI